MKRARIILSSLAILAVVGTTLAFSANRTTFFVYKIDETGACPKLGKFNTGTISQSPVYTTTIDAGASVPATKCTKEVFVAAE